MFTTSTETRIDPWVLIHPYDTQIGQPSTHKKDLQLFRICAKAPASSCFISAKSIIRGVIIIPTFNKESEYYVFDLLNTDLFVCVQELWKEHLVGSQ